MALTSDFDWAILLGVAALLLLGPNNGPLLRTVGRWYGRAMRLKQELLGELTRAAELPGEATIPDPAQSDDTIPDTRGRSFE